MCILRPLALADHHGAWGMLCTRGLSQRSCHCAHMRVPVCAIQALSPVPAWPVATALHGPLEKQLQLETHLRLARLLAGLWSFVLRPLPWASRPSLLTCSVPAGCPACAGCGTHSSGSAGPSGQAAAQRPACGGRCACCGRLTRGRLLHGFPAGGRGLCAQGRASGGHHPGGPPGLPACSCLKLLNRRRVGCCLLPVPACAARAPHARGDDRTSHPAPARSRQAGLAAACWPRRRSQFDQRLCADAAAGPEAPRQGRQRR